MTRSRRRDATEEVDGKRADGNVHITYRAGPERNDLSLDNGVRIIAAGSLLR